MAKSKNKTPGVTMEARAAELEAQIRKFDGLTAAAMKTSQMAAAVSAAAKATELRRALMRLRNEADAASIDDPIDRLQRLQRDAAADGSWVAAAQLSKRLDEARAKRAKEQFNESDDMTDAELVALVQRAIASLPERHLEVVEDALAFRRGKPSTVSSQVEQ